MPKNMEMHAGARYVLDEPAISADDGILRAAIFDDVYFSVDDGLAEAQHVFLAGNDLPARMATASHLTIAETGFGSGLNLLAVMQSMETHPHLHLDFISVEAYPLSPVQMKMVHDQFPSLAPFAQDLCANLPPRWPGHHVVPLMEGRVSLHLLYGEAEHVLRQTSFQADAWFLDGFTPARNPGMWSKTVLSHISRLTAVGGTFSSFTAASDVRAGLSETGFEVQKAKGFGRKRDMIRGVKPGRIAELEPTPQRVAIIGGGVAGASVAAGLRRRGCEPVVIEMADRIASGASGNRLALQTPRLSVDHNPASQLSSTCLAFATRLADRVDASRSFGVLSLDSPEREAVRHQKFRAQQWPNDLLQSFSAARAADMVNAPIADNAMYQEMGRVIDPVRFVTALISDAELYNQFAVDRIVTEGQTVVVVAEDGRSVDVDAVVVALGAQMGPFLSTNGIDGVRLDVTSGQVSHLPITAESVLLEKGLSFGGYLTPAVDGLHELGATFDRTGAMALTTEGHVHNLNLLPAALRDMFSTVDEAQMAGRVSQRASTPDRNPVMGRLRDRIYTLGALGARGFTLAPLLGDTLAAEIMSRPNTMDSRVSTLLDPFRFRMRGSKL